MERLAVGEHRLVDRARARGEAQLRRQRSDVGVPVELGVVLRRPVEAERDRRHLGRSRLGRCVQRGPPHGAVEHLDAGPAADHLVEPALGTDQDVGADAVEHPAIVLEHPAIGTGGVDELDVGADQPPAHRLQPRVHPDEALGGVVGIDPHRPCRSLQQRRHPHDAVGHLGERRVHLDQPVELVTIDGLFPRRAEPGPQRDDGHRFIAQRLDHQITQLTRTHSTHAPDDAAAVRGTRHRHGGRR